MSATTSRDDFASPDAPQMLRLHGQALNGHVRRVWCVAPFPDNERIVSASDDGSVIVWNLRTRKKERHWFHEGGATTIAVSPDGKKVVSGGRDCALRLWDADSEHPLSGPWRLHEDRVWSVAWSPDGSRIASCSADNKLIIWNAQSSPGEPFLEPIQTGHDVVRAVAYCPKGRRIATCGHDSTIKIWDDAGGLYKILTGHTERVLSVVWTKDGNRIISGSTDGTTRVWNLEQNMECTTLAHTGAAISCVAVSDHVYAAASTNNTIVLWNPKDHQRLNCSFELPKRDEVHCVAFTPNGITLIVCTEGSDVYTFDIGEIIWGLEGWTWKLIRSATSVILLSWNTISETLVMTSKFFGY